MFRGIARYTARRLAPDAFVDQQRFTELIGNLRSVKEVCGYDFPTTAVLIDWIIRGVVLDENPRRDVDVPKITVTELLDWLRQQNSGAEAEELAPRLRATLESNSVELICRGMAGWQSVPAPSPATGAARRLRVAYENLARRRSL